MNKSAPSLVRSSVAPESPVSGTLGSASRRISRVLQASLAGDEGKETGVLLPSVTSKDAAQPSEIATNRILQSFADGRDQAISSPERECGCPPWVERCRHFDGHLLHEVTQQAGETVPTTAAAVAPQDAPSQREPAASSPTCPHHWLIESPAGPTCEGVCRKCNARRIFPTSADSSAWTVWREGGMSPENTAGNYSKWLPL